MTAVAGGPLADCDAELNPEEAAWVAYVARHDRIAAAHLARTPAEQDALRREFGYPTPRRRWRW